MIVICHRCGSVFECEDTPVVLPEGSTDIEYEYYCDECCDNGFLKVTIAIQAYPN
jgi:primosomal protein N'